MDSASVILLQFAPLWLSHFCMRGRKKASFMVDASDIQEGWLQQNLEIYLEQALEEAHQHFIRPVGREEAEANTASTAFDLQASQAASHIPGSRVVIVTTGSVWDQKGQSHSTLNTHMESVDFLISEEAQQDMDLKSAFARGLESSQNAPPQSSDRAASPSCLVYCSITAKVSAKTTSSRLQTLSVECRWGTPGSDQKVR
ncbi:unnamed protein product [Durusdinium trenchii]|uniref:Uncharacterized protein n=1 Tax=Durusdinium trenchii TaxID=1381693 RepID=A0ABP0HYU3_9DINO